jgi:riboflavin synthase
MFTGIIEEVGEIVAVRSEGGAAQLDVRGPLAIEGVHHGDSISVAGVCLTVVGWEGDVFTADVMAQTLAVTTHSTTAPGDRVNLERAAKVGDRIGGHIVQGHIDGVATLLTALPGSAWRVLRFALPADLAALVVDKGSIAVNGVSLTVSAVSAPAEMDAWFEVSLIPETLAATTLGALEPGAVVNIETDILARHVERMLAMSGTNTQKETTR